MKRGLYLFALLMMVLVYSCSKDCPDAVETCLEPDFWAYMTVDSSEVDTRGACNPAYVVYDTAWQYFRPNYLNSKGEYLVTAASRVHVYDDTTYWGAITAELSFFAPDSIVTTTVSGADTTRRVALRHLCYLLQTGRLVFFASQMEQYELNGGYFAYTDPDNTDYQLKLDSTTEMDILGNEDIRNVQLRPGYSADICICQVGFDITVQDSSMTQQVTINGLARLPFK